MATSSLRSAQDGSLLAMTELGVGVTVTLHTLGSVRKGDCHFFLNDICQEEFKTIVNTKIPEGIGKIGAIE